MIRTPPRNNASNDDYLQQLRAMNATLDVSSKQNEAKLSPFSYIKKLTNDEDEMRVKMKERETLRRDRREERRLRREKIQNTDKKKSIDIVQNNTPVIEQQPIISSSSPFIPSKQVSFEQEKKKFEYAIPASSQRPIYTGQQHQARPVTKKMELVDSRLEKIPVSGSSSRPSSKPSSRRNSVDLESICDKDMNIRGKAYHDKLELNKLKHESEAKRKKFQQEQNGLIGQSSKVADIVNNMASLSNSISPTNHESALSVISRQRRQSINSFTKEFQDFTHTPLPFAPIKKEDTNTMYTNDNSTSSSSYMTHNPGLMTRKQQHKSNFEGASFDEIFGAAPKRQYRLEREKQQFRQQVGNEAMIEKPPLHPPLPSPLKRNFPDKRKQTVPNIAASSSSTYQNKQNNFNNTRKITPAKVTTTTNNTNSNNNQEVKPAVAFVVELKPAKTTKKPKIRKFKPSKLKEEKLTKQHWDNTTCVQFWEENEPIELYRTETEMDSLSKSLHRDVSMKDYFSEMNREAVVLKSETGKSVKPGTRGFIDLKSGKDITGRRTEVVKPVNETIAEKIERKKSEKSARQARDSQRNNVGRNHKKEFSVHDLLQGIEAQHNDLMEEWEAEKKDLLVNSRSSSSRRK